MKINSGSRQALFEPGARYAYVQSLGEGAMGSVDLVFDRRRCRHVARKRVRGEKASLLALKREFRALEPLAHDNLTRVFELDRDDEGVFFTMEAVDGVDLAAHCAGAESLSCLIAAVGQILAALAYLHARGIVHCDLKPSNVLVSADGRVKLLDFGVLAELGPRGAATAVGGTPGYMAPEQIRGEPPTAASDIYALAAMIFEIVTGQPVFAGSRKRMLEAHLERAAPRLTDLRPDVPASLDALCKAMLDKSPDRRPDLEHIAKVLAIAADRHLHPSAPDNDLIGREDTVAKLRTLLADEGGRFRLIALRGASWVGKTTLADHLASDAHRAGHAVLWGAARPAERVAFNAMDAAMDDVARLVAQQRDLAKSTHDLLRTASSAFPVLEPWSAPALDATREDVRARLFGWRKSNAAPSRLTLFDTIAELIATVGRDGAGTLLVVDDFQWADDDSVALVERCLAARHTRVRFVFVVRDDVEPNAATRWLEARADVTHVDIAPLDDADIATLIRRRVAERGEAISEEAIARAVQTCAGRPFLAEAAGRAVEAGVAHLDNTGGLGGLLRAASARDGRLLALLVAADEWTELALLGDVLIAPLGEVDDAVDRLVRAGLVRRGARADLDGCVDLCHDGVRVGALEVLAQEEVREAHAMLAERARCEGGARRHRLVRHLLGAGSPVEAAMEAREAARHAASQRAFGLAADLYATALQHPGDEHEALLEARASALERAGKYTEAVACWSALAARAGGDQIVDLHLRVAHAFIAAGRTREGLDRLDDALRAAGEDPTGTGTLTTLRAGATFVARALRVRRHASPRSDGTRLVRAERSVKIGILLSFLDPVMGLRHLQRAQTGFEAAGAIELAANCDYLFAVLALVGSRRIDRVWLAERYRAAADRRIAGRAVRPEVQGMPAFIDGLTALRRGRWDAAHRWMARAVAVFAESDGTTERMMASSWAMMADVYRQDLPAMKRHLAWFRTHASECGDTIISAHVELLCGYVLVLEGRFEESAVTLDQLVAMFHEARPNVQRDAARLYRGAADIYLDDPPRARERFEQARKSAARHRFFGTMYAGPLAMIGALLEANALRSADRLASPRRVEAYARIVDDSPPLSAGSSWRARAYAADALGDPAKAIRLLERAERSAARFGRQLDVAIARHQRGRRLGGDLGRELCAEARATVEQLGAAPSFLDEDAGLRR